MDGDEDNIAGIVSFFNEGDVPDSIKTVCDSVGGANISGIVGNVIPEVTFCCNEGRGVEPLPNTQEELKIVCNMENERGGSSDSESEPIPNTQQALEIALR